MLQSPRRNRRKPKGESRGRGAEESGGCESQQEAEKKASRKRLYGSHVEKPPKSGRRSGRRRDRRKKAAAAKAAAAEKAAADKAAKAAAKAAAAKAAAAKEADGVDNLLGDLSSGKNAPKTGGGAKGNNASAAGSGNTKNSASGADINNYAGQIKSAIESKFYDASSYAGKTCTLRIKLAPDGLLLNIQSEGGDPALCQAALAAARQAKFPKPPSRQYMKSSKCATGLQTQ